MSPLSRDPERREAQLANLRPGAKTAPVGNQRTVSHGAYSEALVADVEPEIRELLDRLADAAPVREPDGSLPAADAVAVERAARALKRYRALSAWLDAHGRLDEKTGDPKPAAEHELRVERELAAALAALGMDPASRVKMGVDLQRAATSAEEAENARQARQRLDQRLAEIDHDQGGDDGATT